MKAYRVRNTYDDWQELVFARHHSTAKWEVAAAYPTVCGQTIYPVLVAHRLPHMDGYADPFAKRGHIERDRTLQRLSGIFPCGRCGGKNGDGNLCCAKCEANAHARETK